MTESSEEESSKDEAPAKKAPPAKKGRRRVQHALYLYVCILTHMYAYVYILISCALPITAGTVGVLL
jgi:hypothetical protein